MSSFRKLPSRYAGFVLPFIISILMSCIVSGVATFHSIGITPDFLSIWMSGWGFSWMIAFPALLVVLPIARRLAMMVVDTP